MFITSPNVTLYTRHLFLSTAASIHGIRNESLDVRVFLSGDTSLCVSTTAASATCRCRELGGPCELSNVNSRRRFEGDVVLLANIPAPLRCGGLTGEPNNVDLVPTVSQLFWLMSIPAGFSAA